MIESLLLHKLETQDCDELVLRKFCNMISVLGRQGQIEDVFKVESNQLKDLLFTCIQYGKVKETKTIISLSDELLNSKNIIGETPILCAAKLNQKEIVLLLAEEKPDISIASDDGEHLRDFIQGWEDVIQVLMKVFIILSYLLILKLYCGYRYTRPCMINRIWGLK